MNSKGSRAHFTGQSLFSPICHVGKNGKAQKCISNLFVLQFGFLRPVGSRCLFLIFIVHVASQCISIYKWRGTQAFLHCIKQMKYITAFQLIMPELELESYFPAAADSHRSCK